MKFSDYLFNPGVRPLSVLMGFIIGGVTAIFTGWKFGAFTGAIAVLVLAIIIPVVVYVQDLPYIKIKKRLPQPFLLDVRVSMTAKKGMVDGYFILTENSMIFLSVSDGTHSLELSRDDVKTVRMGDHYSVHVFLKDTQLIRFRTPSCEAIIKVLSEKGWC